MTMQTTTKIPAGIRKADQRCEIYAHQQKAYATFKGRSVSFDELPQAIKDYFMDEYLEDITAQISIREDLHVIGFNRAFSTYLICNYGGFDFEADYDGNHQVKKEYWNCGNRFNCPGEGKVCKPWVMTHYGLSVREIEVIKNIAQGYTDVQIADRLELAESTIPTHASNIRRKINAACKADITRFAKENNIL